jgi:hypothetical protein
MVSNIMRGCLAVCLIGLAAAVGCGKKAFNPGMGMAGDGPGLPDGGFGNSDAGMRPPMPNDGGGSMTDCRPRSCEQAQVECGAASDGCDGIIQCGQCEKPGQLCGGGGVPSTCGGGFPDDCAPKSCADQGAECGAIDDDCGGIVQCGACGSDTACGVGGVPGTCGEIASLCTARTCSQQGIGCGKAGDGCDGEIECGGCSTPGETCGGGGTPSQCGASTSAPPVCTPTATSCAALGWSCGTAVNNCGDTYDCAAEGRSCSGLAVCQGGITGPAECVTVYGPECALCPSVPDCSGQNQPTRLTGRVITPGRTNGDTQNQVGVPNAIVYILQTNDLNDLPAVESGIPLSGTRCDRCDAQDLGPVLAGAITDAQGNYSLEGNIPIDTEFLLVVKVGKFRRAERRTLTAGAACSTTQIPHLSTRLPRDRGDGLAVNIPRIAVSTGRIDAIECVLYKMGIAQSEFAVPGSDGSAAQRVHMYASEMVSSSNQPAFGQVMASSSTGTSAAELYGTAERLNSYDMVIFDCEAAAYDRAAASDARVRQYVNRGGRVFASHWSYTWLYDNGNLNYSPATATDTRLDTSANWGTGLVNSDTGYVSVGRPRANPDKIDTFASWLLNEGAVTQNGSNYTFQITDPRDLAASVNAGSEEWVYRTANGTCGSCRNISSQSLCTANSASCTWTGSSCTERASCNSNCRNQCGDGRYTTQSACTAHNNTAGCAWTPHTPPTTPVQQYSFNTPFNAPADAVCGRVAYSGFHVAGSSSFNGVVFPNGCTNAAANNGVLTSQEKVLLYMLFDLGACVGDPPTPPSCAPRSCSDLGAECGVAPDGCGSTLNCGSCPPGSTCINNRCDSPECNPRTCEQAGAECGFIADGCGDTVNCGPCPQGRACGAGGTPNQCDPVCTPRTCEQADAECGMISDHCDGVRDCGPCPEGQVCGGDGVPNKCGGRCTPQACELGETKRCGQVADGCGDLIACECPPGWQCGLSMPNVCGRLE